MKSKSTRTFAGVLCWAGLLALGGCASVLPSERLRYEVQLLDDRTHQPVEGAAVRAEPGQPWQVFEGTTDREGIYVLDRSIPTFAQHSVGSHRNPWLKVGVRKEGFEPLVLELAEAQFLRKGSLLCRVEAVLLKMGPP